MKYAVSYHRERHPGIFAKVLYSTASEPIEVIAEENRREPEAAKLYGPFEYDAEFVADYVARWKELQKKYRPDLLWVDHSPVFFKRWNTDGYDDPEIHHFRDACMKMIADYLNAGQKWASRSISTTRATGRRVPDSERATTCGSTRSGSSGRIRPRSVLPMATCETRRRTMPTRVRPN
jgi:alpha-L-fucosidase